MNVLQFRLCHCVELCLESIASLLNLIRFTPTEIDLSFSPLPEELLPPIITCKDFSVGEKAQNLLKVCIYTHIPYFPSSKLLSYGYEVIMMKPMV